jgi:hypothetical protein
MPSVKINDLVAAGSVTDTMQFETDISGATSNKVTASLIKTYVLTNLLHSSLSSLGNDDHTQYAKADGTRWTTVQTASRVPVTDANGYLVVSSVTATTLGYLDATSSIQTQLNSKFSASSSVDHNATTNFVANKHIDHTSVSISAGTGLTGGGDISSNRTLSIDITGLTEDLTPSRANDYVVTYDTSATSHKKALISSLVSSGDINHDATTNYSANKHVDHTSVSISTGSGLTGGGDISSTRTLSLDINGLTADDSPVTTDYVVTYDVSATANKKVLVSDLKTVISNHAFTALSDVPNSYSSAGLKIVRVNSAATALEFVTPILEETSAQTTNYTLALTDVNYVVLLNGTSLTLTIPPNSSVAFPVGSVIHAYNAAATSVTTTEGSGVTIRNKANISQYQEVSFRKRATDEWVQVGGG